MGAFWQTTIRFDRKQLALVMALRNALGVAVALFAGILLGNPAGGVMAATGALDTAFSDGNDPYIHRGRRMLTAAAFVSLAVFAGRLCGHNHALTIMLEAICAFTAGILVAAGSTPADIGTITLVTLIVYSASPASQVTITENATETGTAVPLAFAGPFSFPVQVFDFDPGTDLIAPTTSSRDISRNSSRSVIHSQHPETHAIQ